jgi:hypothetical protein
MFPRWWPVVLCGVACAFGCATEQVDDMPSDSSSGDAPSGGTGQAGTGQTQGGTVSALPQAGTSSSSAGTAAKGGTSSGGSGTGTAGTSHAGSASGGAGGGSAGTNGSAGKAGAPTTPTNTNLPFTENFEDGVANGFIPYNDKATPGPWTVVADGAGKVYQPMAPVSELEFAVGGSTTWTDVAMTVKVRLNDADTDAQIILRFKEVKTYLVLEMAEGKFKLRGRAAGSTTDLISPSPKPVITAGTWYTVGITAKGTTVSLTLNGEAVGGSVMCNAAISNGGVAFGMDSGSASFDDLSVTAAP